MVKRSNAANIRELMTYVYECTPKGYACVCFEKPTHLDEMHRNLLQKVVLPMNILLTFLMYVQTIPSMSSTILSGCPSEQDYHFYQ